MNVFKNAVIKKILIVLITIIMINNFIMPNYVHADSLEDAGNKLVSSFFYLLAYVGDAGLSVMQRMMKGTWDLKENGEYAIKYSPGMIFANDVAALKINFITADKNDADEVQVSKIDVHSKKEMNELINLVKADNMTKATRKFITILPVEGSIISGIGLDTEEAPTITDDITNKADQVGLKAEVSYVTGQGTTTAHLGYKLKYPDYSYELTYYEFDNGSFLGFGKDDGTEFVEDLIANPDTFNHFVTFHTYNGELYQREPIYSGYDVTGYNVYKYDLTGLPNSVETITLKSTAGQLKETISTWYIALRTIALVGLLSVLVYLGIRIILSSTSAQDKAKYKNLLKDWLVAMCILFVLHYIMAFILDFVDILNDIMVDTVIGETTLPATGASGNRIDKLMTEVRNGIGNGLVENNGWQTAGNTIMYLALVILTGIFTIQYLKRVVFMAFLTMIAPLIALTYPLDKVKDGKAQAFNYWLREYIFNCLIQPVHLLLYAVLICSAFEFAEENILYSIVALAFMVPAEKIIKEMFGLKSSSPSSTLGAAAGGAFMMSMLNKIKSKPSKDDEAGGGKAPSGVRTASRGPIDSSNPGNNPRDNNSPDNNNPDNNNPPKNNPPKNNPPRNQNNNNSKQGNYNILRGVGEITGFNRLLSAPGTTLRGAAKKGAKVTAGLALGGLAGTTMLANEIADGHLFEDPGGALSKAGGAAVAGYAGGNALVGNAAGTIEKNVDKFRKGAMGVEAYNNQAFDKQIFNSDNYKIIAQDPTIQQEWGKENIKEVAQTFLDNGISDQSVIRSSMQNGVNGDEYKSISSMGITDVKHYRKVRDKNAHKGLNASQIAARMQIAKNLPDRLFNDEAGFIRYAKRFGIDDEAEASRLFNEIDDFT